MISVFILPDFLSIVYLTCNFVCRATYRERFFRYGPKNMNNSYDVVDISNVLFNSRSVCFYCIFMRAILDFYLMRDKYVVE